MISDDELLAFACGDSDAAEEHVMSCTRCADRVASFLRIGHGLAEVVRAAEVATPITSALLSTLESLGLVSRRYVLTPGSTVPCTVGATDMFSILRIEADLTGVTRVDLVRADERLHDVPFDPVAGVVLTATNGRYLRTLPTTLLPVQLLAVDESGERVIASYTLDHTAFAG